MVRMGLLQYWPGVSSCLITEIVSYPRRTVLHFFIAAGELAEIRAMLPPILAWGTAQGCDGATMTGRRGWERSFLRDDGWSAPMIHMDRSL